MGHRVIDVINVLNLLLGSAAFCFLFARTSIRRKEYPREVLLLLVALQAVVVCLLLTSAELIVVPNDAAPLSHLVFLSVVITGSKFGLLWVLWTTRDALYRTRGRHVGGGRNTDELDVNADAPHPKEGD